MKLALVTHHERPRLRGTLPDLWPEFMSHDNVVQAFWPKLYDVYPDFQLWVVDREAQPRRAIGYACSVPVAWDEDAPSPRGLDWALTDGVEGPPTALCAVVAGLAPEYRGRGIAEAILRRLGCRRAPVTDSTCSSRPCGRRGRSAIRSSRSSATPRGGAATVSRTTRGYARTSGSAERCSRARRAR